MRIDYHNRYGLFVLPRLAALYKFSEKWYSRVGAGIGYKTPDPLIQQTTETDMRKVFPVTNNVRAENSLGLNLEFNYKGSVFKKGTITINQAFFFTGIQSPVLAKTDADGSTVFYNETKAVTSKGSDTYIRLHLKKWELYFGYTFTIARNEFNTIQPYIVLTPRHRAATTLVYEIEKKWRFGWEGSYNGRQYLNDGKKSPDYFFIAAMVERKFKKMSVVLNGENLLDARQTRYESIVLKPYINPSFKPLWGPIDGRIINISVVFRM